MNKKQNVGLKVDAPSETCNDAHCPFHGGFSIHGRIFVGDVVKIGGHKSATVQWKRLAYLPKYERYQKKKSKINIHVPDCIKISVGDKVRIAETRPISKTKNFVVIEVIKE